VHKRDMNPRLKASHHAFSDRIENPSRPSKDRFLERIALDSANLVDGPTYIGPANQGAALGVQSHISDRHGIGGGKS